MDFKKRGVPLPLWDHHRAAPGHSFHHPADRSCFVLLWVLLCLHQEENTTSLARVKKDGRLMPPLVFSMEEWERKLVSTGKSAGKNLLRDAKRSFCRDFKVKTSADPQGRPQQQQAGAGAGGQQARSQQPGRARGGANARHSQQQPAASRGSRGSAGSHGRSGSGAGGSSAGQEAAGGGVEDEEMGEAAEGSEEHGDNGSHGGVHGEDEEEAMEEENDGRQQQQQLGGGHGKPASKGAHKASRGGRAPLQRTQV